MRPRGVRGRLVVTVIGLVAATSIVLGLGAYAYVATSLRDQQLHAARDLTDFNVAVLVAERIAGPVTRENVVASRLLDAFALRGVTGTLVDFGDGDPVTSGLDVTGALARLSPAFRAIVAGGDIGFERVALEDRPFLVTGARLPPGGPDFYFFFDASEVEGAIDRLGQALLAGGVALVLVAALAGGAVARGLLLPVRDAGIAAERIADGDLSARLDPGSGDEFGRWALSFNRMAASLEEKVAELEAAQTRERRFVADVAHELRTPLTALVSEASLLQDHLDDIPQGSRRVAELLVGDVARLRTLVDELMEISRFDASAEQLVPVQFELGAFLHAVVAAHAPGAAVSLRAEEGPTADIVADRRRLERVLGNLLDNARLHGGGGEVSLEAEVRTASSAGLELSVVVADRGPGVEPGEIERLFDRFQTADPSRHRGGSGLGLAIAREHARLLGGTVSGARRPRGGMAFEVRVPVARSLPSGNGPAMARGQSAELSDLRTESPP